MNIHAKLHPLRIFIEINFHVCTQNKEITCQVNLCRIISDHLSISRQSRPWSGSSYTMGKRELIALLYMSSWCLVMVERLFLAVPRGCLRFVIVVFPDHTHLLFLWVFSVCKTVKRCFVCVRCFGAGTALLPLWLSIKPLRKRGRFVLI